MKITKTVQRLDREGNATTLATFVMGVKLLSDYRSPSFQRQMERDGIMTKGRVRLWPKDGKAFFDALDKEFANSTTIQVVTTSSHSTGKTDWDESQHPRAQDGKFGEGGGGGSSAKPEGQAKAPSDPKAKAAEAFANRAKLHATVLRQVADKHPDQPQVQAAARVAEEHAKGAEEHPEHAEHHAAGAEAQVHKLREHGEKTHGEKPEGEEGGHEHGQGGSWFQDLLKLISGIKHE